MKTQKTQSCVDEARELPDASEGPKPLGRRVLGACARAAHEANRAYRVAIGEDDNAPPWSELGWTDGPSAIARLCTAAEQVLLQGFGPAQSHDAWLACKRADGWHYGRVKHTARKEHPCLVPYAALPQEQKGKDELFVAVVKAMASALGFVTRAETMERGQLEARVAPKVSPEHAAVLERVEQLLLDSRREQLRCNGHDDPYGVGLLKRDELKPGLRVIHFSGFALCDEEPLEHGVVACEPYEEPHGEKGITASGNVNGAFVVRLEGREKPVGLGWLVPDTPEGEAKLRAASDAWSLSGLALTLLGGLLGGPIWARGLPPTVPEAPPRSDGNRRDTECDGVSTEAADAEEGPAAEGHFWEKLGRWGDRRCVRCGLLALGLASGATVYCKDRHDPATWKRVAPPCTGKA
jgi:hypothetical protein